MRLILSSDASGIIGEGVVGVFIGELLLLLLLDVDSFCDNGVVCTVPRWAEACNNLVTESLSSMCTEFVRFWDCGEVAPF